MSQRECLERMSPDSIEICVIYAKNINTKECPSIPGIKEDFQDEVGTNQAKSLCFIAERPWKNQ